MDTKSSIILATIIGGFLIGDYVMYEGANTLFLARKFVDFLDWLAFWR
jgi:hypothetical protein